MFNMEESELEKDKKTEPIQNGDALTETLFVDPVEETPEPAAPGERQKRGRKSRATSADGTAEPRRRPNTANAKKQVEGLTQQLIGVHKMVAMMPGFEFMELAPQEAQALSEGMVAVGQEYGVALGGKSGAALQFGVAVLMVYGPRVMHFHELKKAARARQVSGEVVTDSSSYSDGRGQNVNVG